MAKRMVKLRKSRRQRRHVRKANCSESFQGGSLMKRIYKIIISIKMCLLSVKQKKICPFKWQTLYFLFLCHNKTKQNNNMKKKIVHKILKWP